MSSPASNRGDYANEKDNALVQGNDSPKAAISGRTLAHPAKRSYSPTVDGELRSLAWRMRVIASVVDQGATRLREITQPVGRGMPELKLLLHQVQTDAHGNR